MTVAAEEILPQTSASCSVALASRDEDHGNVGISDGKVPERTSARPAREARSLRRTSAVSRSNEPNPLLDVLKRMAQGEHTALARCYDQMGPVVFSLAVRMLRDRPAAEDVTQDIFVQVWRQAANYDTGRGSPEAWIMMIARTRILDRLRSRSAGIVLKPVGDNLPDAPDAEDWPEDLAISREDAVNVRRALSELPADQKHAIELAFFDGMTHVEIAEKLNVPLGTIKTRIRLGLIKIRDSLRELMGETLVEPGGAVAAEERV
ncbi:MAG TPA: sigma-70 family RNA polymerase sigma factor [Phycisphaerae bacterium]|nr:sigma-70 family RNA polymerase sigma factor [Phycisphaerae bacterium]